MTALRVLFNTVEAIDAADVFPRLKALRVGAFSMFCELDRAELHPNLRAAAEQFSDINVNLMHAAAYRDEQGWEKKLRADSARVIPELAALGIDNYAWMIECNLNGYRWHPLLGSFAGGEKLAERFGVFYECAHEANPAANVIVVPYPHRLMNQSYGRGGWKDWWVRVGERLAFDAVALDAHVGVWIAAPTDGSVRRHLRDAVTFLKERGHEPMYVEVGYPTHGFKPLAGLYGWGREKDQAALLKTCYEELTDLGVPWMQICECIDPAGEQVYDSRLMGDEGRVPKALGVVPVSEERHWGLLNADGSEKSACEWVRIRKGVRHFCEFDD
jgi:hypothetical protein